jgi:uncharacterized protein (DUF169 family)
MSELSKTELKKIAGRIDRLLRLTSFSVGVKMIPKVEDLEGIKDEIGRPVKQVKGKKLTVCQIIGQARYYGRVLAATHETAGMCTLGSAVVGFRELPENYADGYVRAYFTEEEIARKTIATVPKFQPGAYQAMVAAPLDEMPVPPDVAIFFGNTAQIQRFVQAYLYNKGGRLVYSSCGEAVCGDLIVAPLTIEQPVIGFPCNGARLLSWPSDCEVACGISVSLLDSILQGLEFTHRGQIRYPLTWAHLDWEPQGPIRNVMEGKGIFPPELRHPKKEE